MADINGKKLAAERAVDYIQQDMIIGLGTGSTAYWAIQKIGTKVKEGLRIKAIATSRESEKLATDLQIPLTSFAENNILDLTIDGADEVDKNFNLIKGGGGALLREKIVAAASTRFIVVVDESKIVEQLGKFPLPVEVVPFAFERTIQTIRSLGCIPRIRLAENKFYLTDNGNYIIDCEFEDIAHPDALHTRLNLIPGVVDNGLFVNMANIVVIGNLNGTVEVRTR
jgi:ribose 5-phosphate isomerase A